MNTCAGWELYLKKAQAAAGQGSRKNDEVLIVFSQPGHTLPVGQLPRCGSYDNAQGGGNNKRYP
jgi:hypothetical protein